MRMLRSEFDVTTRFGGRFVQSIDGLEGQGAGGQVDWFFWVNGLEADKGAAEWEVLPGDRIQWDHRDWSAAMRIPAIVGAYPGAVRQRARGQAATGSGGVRGRGLARVQRRRATACNSVGVSTSGSSLGAPGTEAVTRLVVARWPRARIVRGAADAGGRPGGHRRVRPLHARRTTRSSCSTSREGRPGASGAATAWGSCWPSSRAPTSWSGS